jgi:uncharacterized protein with GYD domain
MATYFMFGDYSPESVGKISADRTVQGNALIEKHKGKVIAQYALLGEKDLVLIVDFPGTAEVMQASVALSQLLGIAFSSVPALSVEKFDKLFGA